MKKVLFWIVLALIASGVWSGALGVEEGLTRVELSAEETTVRFTPTANGMYEIYAFPETEGASAEIEVTAGGTRIASGKGSMGVLSARLTAETTYEIRMKGTGSVLVEIARETLSRCFDMPLELGDGEGYSKLIAREGDVHWYAVTAARSGASIITAVPEGSELRLRAMLFDENGRALARSEEMSSGACVMSSGFESGRTYYIRVAGDGTGKYMLSSLRSAVEGVPESVRLSSAEMEFSGRQRGLLMAETSPAGVCPLVFFNSSDPGVAVVRLDGSIETRSAGTAVITAYAYGGAKATCEIRVAYVPVSGVSLSEAEISLQVGEEAALNVSVAPENASVRGVTFVTEDESVVTVDERGTLTAVGEGSARVSVTTEDGGLTDEVLVHVAPAERRYRALLIGEQNYASTVEQVRPGSMNSVLSIEKLLKTASFGESGFAVRTLMDAPRDSVIAAIRETFADAAEDDLSVVYITCHGFYKAGMSFFLMADGSVLSAVDLERELRGIPGEVVLLADCCGSGGLLGEASGQEDFLKGITSVFQGMIGGSWIHGSKVSVVASAMLDQDSYRISFSDNSETGMATVFARALCDAMGWSIDRDARSSMNADANYDGEITLDELAGYMSRRVNWYLSLAGDYVQTVNVYPEGSGLRIFARET